MNRFLLGACIAAASCAAVAHAEGVPKSLETFGLKIGDTAQQVEKVLVPQGFILNSTGKYPAEVAKDSISGVKYIKAVGGKLGVVEVTFGPSSGRAVQVRRWGQNFDQKALVADLRKQLAEKYGTPHDNSTSQDLRWISTVTGKPDGKCGPNSDISPSFVMDSQLEKVKTCDKAIAVAIKGYSEWATGIDVTIVDYAAVAKEWEPIILARQRAKQAEIDNAKKVPASKL